ARHTSQPAPLRAAVSAALSTAPGLSAASPAQIERLGVLLAAGGCAQDALRDVFGTINRQTLVFLVRDLGGC
ncbi:MAG TPA: hypothetical protein VM422_00905, partial [Amaricoccus sp.]|nr:hypothetical protein [Amaricoccus sp.]